MIAASAVNDDQPFIAANAMFGMNYQITCFKNVNLAQTFITFGTF